MVTLWAVTAKTDPPSVCQSESSAPLQPGSLLPQAKQGDEMIGGNLNMPCQGCNSNNNSNQDLLSKLMLCSWKKKKILLAGFDWLSLKWGRLALSCVLIFHRGSLGFCLWCLSWNSLFTSLLHLAVLSTHLCMCRSDPARPQPHKTRARRLQSSGSAALLYLEQLYCFYNRKASGSFLLPLAPRK